MKTEMPSFIYKEKLSKKLKKFIYNNDSSCKISNKKMNFCYKRPNEIITHLDTDQNKNKQNSVIPKHDIEKSLIYAKNSYKSVKYSLNNTNSEENSNLYSQFREIKENIPSNGYYKGLLSTKSKKVNASLNKFNHKKDILYHNNSSIKKINLKSLQNFNNDINNKLNLEQISLGNKNRTVLKNSSKSKYKSIKNEIKIKKKIKSFGLLPFDLNNKNSLLKIFSHNSNNFSNNIVQNYHTQKNVTLRNNFIYKNNFNLQTTQNLNDFSKENVFNHNEERKIELTKEEKLLYGDRIMKGYSKIKLLGKGGYGVVWLCNKKLNQNETKEYAVKQTSKKRNQESSHNLNHVLLNARNEIEILKLLNNNNLDNNSESNDSKDNKNEINFNDCELIPKIYESYEDNNDIWFSFEKGGNCLSNLCFKIKGEFEKNERIYLIQKGQFLENLFTNIDQFKYLLKQLVKGINYINSKGIIHSDIKPENILIDYTKKLDCFKINSVKIIDYGSSFLFNEISSSTTSNTPEYLCPEITINNIKFVRDLTNSNKYISAVDIWSLGITFLELCLCCPIWMNFKTKIVLKGKNLFTHGLFGCKMRDASKIYQKQIEVSKKLKSLLNNSLLYLFEKEDRDNFIDLLGKMLNIDYIKRISAQDILKHPFFNEKND